MVHASCATTCASSRIWLKKHLQLDFTEQEVENFRRMDDPGIIKNIYAIARLAAELQVKREHFFPDNPGRRRRPDSRWTRPRAPFGDGGWDFCRRRRPDLADAATIGAFCTPA